MKRGFFELNRPQDLFEKLKWELELLRRYPGDAWHAFNFFVTAEHMADWVQNVEVKRREPILRICSHLANGAKHFIVRNRRHRSIVRAEADPIAKEGLWDDERYGEPLVVELSEEESRLLHEKELGVCELASRILDFWEAYMTEHWHSILRLSGEEREEGGN